MDCVAATRNDDDSELAARYHHNQHLFIQASTLLPIPCTTTSSHVPPPCCHNVTSQCGWQANNTTTTTATNSHNNNYAPPRFTLSPRRAGIVFSFLFFFFITNLTAPVPLSRPQPPNHQAVCNTPHKMEHAGIAHGTTVGLSVPFYQPCYLAHRHPLLRLTRPGRPCSTNP